MSFPAHPGVMMLTSLVGAGSSLYLADGANAAQSHKDFRLVQVSSLQAANVTLRNQEVIHESEIPSSPLS